VAGLLEWLVRICYQFAVERPALRTGDHSVAGQGRAAVLALARLTGDVLLHAFGMSQAQPCRRPQTPDGSEGVATRISEATS